MSSTTHPVALTQDESRIRLAEEITQKRRAKRKKPLTEAQRLAKNQKSRERQARIRAENLEQRELIKNKSLQCTR